MKKEFVPYELALRMKALGFDEPCMGVHYDVHYDNEEDTEFTLRIMETQYYAQKGYKNGILAPIFSQAFLWVMQFPQIKKYRYNVALYSDGTYSLKEGKDALYEYLSAESCLEKLIEIVEQKVA